MKKTDAFMTRMKQSKERETRYGPERKIELEYEVSVFDIMAMLIMLLSLISVFSNWKIVSWTSFMMSFMNICNFRKGNEVRQMLSSFFLSGMSLLVVYGRDPAPIFEMRE